MEFKPRVLRVTIIYSGIKTTTIQKRRKLGFDLWFSAEAEGNGADKRTLAGAIRANDEVETRSRAAD